MLEKPNKLEKPSRYKLDIDFLKSDFEFIMEEAKHYDGSLRMYVSSLIKKDQRIKKLSVRAKYAAHAKAIEHDVKDDIAATIVVEDESNSAIINAISNIINR